MSDITYDDLALYRRRWVRTVLNTYAFGELCSYVVPLTLKLMKTGMYTVMVIMTLYHLLARGKGWTRNRVILGYTIFMLMVTVGEFYTSTRMDEAETIETLAGPDVSSEISVGDSCTPLDYISTVLSLLQFWGNDALMV
jgi:hypothetical protein